ncbi:MAG: Asp/Glu racemase [Actinomycetota bacterium]|nr:Asp/Glu racemase [Actinomycetota bacterium]
MAANAPRIGLLIPSSNTTMERDFHRFFGDDAHVHTDRMYLGSVTRAAEEAMLDDEVLPAARRIATTRPDVIVFGCTSAGAIRGVGADDRMRAEIAEVTGTAVVGVTPSIRDELAGSAGVAVLTPYVDDLTAAVADSVRAFGLTVTATRSLGYEDNLEIGALTPARIRDAATGFDPAGAEVLFCSCTNLRAMEAIDDLERATGLRVRSSNEVTAVRVAHVLGLRRGRTGAVRTGGPTTSTPQP